MNVLIVRTHHEPRSFCSALAERAEAALVAQGHSVEVSDLARSGFDPVSDRRNFQEAKDPGYLKQQAEEIHASETGTFVPEIAWGPARMSDEERAEDAVLAGWKRSGILLSASRSAAGVTPRRTHLVARAGSDADVRARVAEHPELEVEEIRIEEIETLL